MTYADYVAIVSNNGKQMKGMIRTYKSYLKKKRAGVECSEDKNNGV